MRYGIIYIITNKINGKQYVGQTQYTAEIRFKRHQIEGCPAIYSAIKKYGKSAFIIEEIASAFNQVDINYLEKYFIKYYNTISPNGYNIDAGGNVISMTRETIEKANLTRAYLIVGTSVDDGDEIVFRGRNSASQYGFTPAGVYHSIRRGFIHRGYIFKYVNQSGRTRGKKRDHAQRLDGEPGKTEQKPSKSPGLVPNSKLLQIKGQIIRYYLACNSSYKVAKRFKTDTTRIKKLLKSWDVIRGKSESATIRNLNRYRNR